MFSALSPYFNSLRTELQNTPDPEDSSQKGMLIHGSALSGATGGLQNASVMLDSRQYRSHSCKTLLQGLRILACKVLPSVPHPQINSSADKINERAKDVFDNVADTMELRVVCKPFLTLESFMQVHLGRRVLST